MSSVGVVPFLIFQGEHGTTVLQKAEDISTVISAWKPARAGQPGYAACYLLLKNNNRVEVMGESVTTIFDKLEAANGFRPVIVGAAGQVTEHDAQPKPEKESENA